MVRTECRKCRWGSVDRGACEIPYQHPMQLAVWLWTQKAKAAWEDGMVYYYWNKCPGCVKREKAESHPLTTTPVVTHDGGEGEQQAISAEPRKRSEESKVEICGGCDAYVLPADGRCRKCGWKKPDQAKDSKALVKEIAPAPAPEAIASNSQAILDGSEPDGCQCAAGPWRFDMENMPTDGTRIWVALKECDGFKYCRYSSARCTYKGEDGFEVWSLCPGIGIGREQIEAWAEIMPIGGK